MRDAFKFIWFQSIEYHFPSFFLEINIFIILSGDSALRQIHLHGLTASMRIYFHALTFYVLVIEDHLRVYVLIASLNDFP